MKARIKQIIMGLMVALGIGLAVAPVAAQAQSKADICQGIGLTTGTNTTNCAPPPNSPTVNSTLTTVVNILSFVVGFIAVVMVIIGGLKYVLSSGDSNQINSAKNTVLFALVGLAIAALAQILVRFVLNKISP